MSEREREQWVVRLKFPDGSKKYYASRHAGTGVTTPRLVEAVRFSSSEGASFIIEEIFRARPRELASCKFSTVRLTKYKDAARGLGEALATRIKRKQLTPPTTRVAMEQYVRIYCFTRMAVSTFPPGRWAGMAKIMGDTCLEILYGHA